MIRFLDNAFVGGRFFSVGMMAQFNAPTEAQLISVGDAVNFQVISQPVEVLFSAAVQALCISTATDEILASGTISAGIIGPNSIVQFEPVWTFPSSVNNKICKVKLGAATVYTATRTTSLLEAPLIALANRNSLASQVIPYPNGKHETAGATTVGAATVNFALDVVWQITGQRANSGEALALEYYRILHFIGS